MDDRREEDAGGLVRSSWVGVIVLTMTCAAAAYRSSAAGDVGSVGFVIVLTMTCAAAAYRSSVAGDVGSVGFVIVSYGALLLLLRSLRAYELMMAAAAADDDRERLRRKVWALCTLLTAMFAWKVAGVMPWPVAIGIWVAAAATSAAGFVIMFRQQQRRRL